LQLEKSMIHHKTSESRRVKASANLAYILPLPGEMQDNINLRISLPTSKQSL
jgi:hypothetical protein